MESADLRVFEAVLRHGNMKRAAEELNTVQSNVTARIRALEEAHGVALFERHARGVTPTQAAERLRPFALQVTRLLADARIALRDNGSPSGPLRLGSMETTMALRLAPLLSRFALLYPSVQLSITTGSTAQMVRAVAEGRLDGAFVSGPLAHPTLRQQTMFREELVLLTSTAIRSVEDLAAQATIKLVVFQPGCSYRQRLEATLARQGIVTTEWLVFGSLDAIMACVEAGAGVTLLPRAVAAPALAQGRVMAHTLPTEQAMVETLFVQRQDAYISSALAAFIGMMPEQH